MATKTKKTETESWTATQIASFINEAATPAQKGAATKRLKAYLDRREGEGADRKRVESNIRSLCNRLGRG